jgi:hypothetical protein
VHFRYHRAACREPTPSNAFHRHIHITHPHSCRESHKREGRAHSQLKHSLGVAAAGALSILALGAAATPAIASLTLTSAGQASSDGTAVQQVFPWET